MQFLIANWKSHKTIGDAVEWMNIFTSFSLSSLSPELKIVVCPTFPLLAPIVNIAQNHLIKLGSQDISQFSVGAHTGEVSGENLSGLVEYVIIGHSERRINNKESEESVRNKINQAKSFSIEPIVCINANTNTNYDTNIIVFEPVSSIGSGHVDSRQHVIDFKSSLKKQYQHFLYGGSVTVENTKNYLERRIVDGLLVGANSLDPLSFFSIAKQF